MLRNRWILVDRVSGEVVGVVAGIHAPDESDTYYVMAHPTAERGKHSIDPITEDMQEFTKVLSVPEQRSKFKEERGKALKNATVTYEGMVFDADEVSQNRMLRPIAVLQNDTDTQLWVLHNNDVVYLTRPQFIDVLALAGQQQTALWVQD